MHIFCCQESISIMREELRPIERVFRSQITKHQQPILAKSTISRYCRYFDTSAVTPLMEYIYCDHVSKLMFFTETVEFYYRVKLIRFILLSNMKIKINCFWLVILCPEGAGRASCGAGCNAVVPASLFESLTV